MRRRRPDPTTDAWYDDDAGPVVRPYAMTGGRTRPVTGGFELTTLVRARPQGLRAVPELPPEQALIIELCREPISVAEIAAHLRLPLGTVRVLLGDLRAVGLITTVEPAARESRTDMLEALLAGLRTL